MGHGTSRRNIGLHRLSSPSTGQHRPSSFDPLLFLLACHKGQRREVVEVARHICIEDIAVVLGHLQSTVSEYPLKSERIAAAINEILACERVAEEDLLLCQVHIAVQDVPHRRGSASTVQ